MRDRLDASSFDLIKRDGNLKMEFVERRKDPRHKIKIAVNVHQEGRRIPAAIRNISRRGIGLVSQKRISLGARAIIRLLHADDYAIHGTVEWAILTYTDGQFLYRTGIKADKVLALEDIIDRGI